MASKDKTSKTARVMNLLSKKADPAAEEVVEAPAAPTPPRVTSIAPDVAVSAPNKDAQEDALEGELPPKAAAPAPQPQPEPAPATVQAASQPEPAPVTVQAASQPAPVAEPAPVTVQAAPRPESVAEPVSAPVQAAAPALEPEQPLAPAAPEPEDKWSGYLFPNHPGYINVMQVLVEEKAPNYIQMFGLCSCQRCLEDVKALTLNHLAPKYVVLERGDMVPRLTVYESKFGSDITAQLLQACKLVMERPHHGR